MNKPNINSSLSTWLEWLLQVHPQAIELGLTRVGQVAKTLKVNDFSCPVITVAGTNGKGSSVAMLQAIYLSAGYKVGCYTSPHLLNFNERIRLYGCDASDAQIVEAFIAIEQARANISLTYFEFATLAALYIFKCAEQNSSLDIIILEVGLGGRLDAVNLLDADLALITAIDIDHTDWLGNDISQIALEKAAIMRKNTPAVCSDVKVQNSLIQYSIDNKVPLKLIDRDFRCTQNNKAWLWQDTETSLELPYPKLQGSFQLNNAAGVIASINTLQLRLPVSLAAMQHGLTQTNHAGRLQTIKYMEHEWLVDVAHNPQASQALSIYLKQNNLYLNDAIFAVFCDKNIKAMVEYLTPFIKHWHIVDLKQPRSSSVTEIANILMDVGIKENQIIKHNTIKDAITANAKKIDQTTLVWGSFLTVASFMENTNGS